MLITIDTIGNKKYLVMKTEINGEEYDPDMPTTYEAWDELEQHMLGKSWWTLQHAVELSRIRWEQTRKGSI